MNRWARPRVACTALHAQPCMHSPEPEPAVPTPGGVGCDVSRPHEHPTHGMAYPHHAARGACRENGEHDEKLQAFPAHRLECPPRSPPWSAPGPAPLPKVHVPPSCSLARSCPPPRILPGAVLPLASRLRGGPASAQPPGWGALGLPRALLCGRCLRLQGGHCPHRLRAPLHTLGPRRVPACPHDALLPP